LDGSSKTIKLKEDKRCFTCAVTHDLSQIVELQMIRAGKTERVHANVSTPDSRIRQDHSETHFQTDETCLAWAGRLHEHASECARKLGVEYTPILCIDAASQHNGAIKFLRKKKMALLSTSPLATPTSCSLLINTSLLLLKRSVIRCSTALLKKLFPADEHGRCAGAFV
jgi:hypothetical protein